MCEKSPLQVNITQPPPFPLGLTLNCREREELYNVFQILQRPILSFRMAASELKFPASALNIAVTGGSGLIGQRVVQYLSEQAAIASVTSVDAVPPKTDAVPNSKIRTVQADLTDFENTLNILRGHHAVIHLASKVTPSEVLAHVPIGIHHTCVRPPRQAEVSAELTMVRTSVTWSCLTTSYVLQLSSG